MRLICILDLLSFLQSAPYEPEKIQIAEHNRFSMPVKDVPYNKLNRLDRANSFLFSARTASSHHEKITFYVMILECLFSATQKTETTFLVSQRIAIYLGNTLDERLQIVKDIKTIYDIRSKFVHGQKLHKDYNNPIELVPFSVKADDYIRRILTKIIRRNGDGFTENDDNKFESWFNKQVLAPFDFTFPVAEQLNDVY